MEAFDKLPAEINHLVSSFSSIPVVGDLMHGITQYTFWLIVSSIVLLIIMFAFAKRVAVVPRGRFANAVEYVIEYLENDVGVGILGKESWRRHLPFLGTLFMFIVVNNIIGIIPGMNMAATATVVMPLVFAVWVLIQYWITAAREKGLWGYIRDECFPKGVPWPVYILLAPIQLCELVLIRPASLTIRLFANMISGHLLVASCLAFAQYWVIDATNKLAGIPVGALWFVFGLVLTLFEAFVAFLQAYVFAILSTVYISMSYPEE